MEGWPPRNLNTLRQGACTVVSRVAGCAETEARIQAAEKRAARLLAPCEVRLSMSNLGSLRRDKHPGSSELGDQFEVYLRVLQYSTWLGPSTATLAKSGVERRQA